MDNRATRNHILLTAIKRIELPYRQKENLYPLIIISGDLILYGDGIIHFKTGPVKIMVKK